MPKGYEMPKSNSHYLKLQDGDNLVRILAKPIMGWLDWSEDGDGKRSPVRTPFTDQKPAPIKADKPVKHFWAFPVWDYKDKAVKIWEITQASIQEVIYNLDSDESWGDPTGYDLKINRTGEKLETKYSVIARPPKPLAKEIIAEFKEVNPDLNELFSNGDPFAKQADQEPQEPGEDEEINVANIPF